MSKAPKRKLHQIEPSQSPSIVKKKRRLNQSCLSKFETTPKEEKHADVTFEIGEGDQCETFRCIKYLFAVQSSVFDKMLYGSMIEATNNEVIIKDITPNAFRFIRDTFYMRSPIVNVSNVIEVWYASNKYLLENIKEECKDFIKSVNSFEDLISLSKSWFKYPCTSLTDIICCLVDNAFVSKNTVAILKNNNILLNTDYMCLLLKHITEENTKLEVCVEWSKQKDSDWVNTMKHFLKYIDFTKMDEDYLFDKVKSLNVVTSDELIGILKEKRNKSKCKFDIKKLMLRREKLDQLKVGDYVDRRDRKGHFYLSKIVARTGNKINIQFESHPDAVDKNIPIELESLRILAPNTATQMHLECTHDHHSQFQIGDMVDINIAYCLEQKEKQSAKFSTSSRSAMICTSACMPNQDIWTTGKIIDSEHRMCCCVQVFVDVLNRNFWFALDNSNEIRLPRQVRL